MGKKKSKGCSSCEMAQNAAVRKAAMNNGSSSIMSFPVRHLQNPQPIPQNAYNQMMRNVYGK